ncbi:glycosyltransferase family 2 protein [Sunxiuqinia sp. A32]|uniref:glycosyltransferase family 2 protein n=1 Tax=Sunxiuqinia sp. A32 TaxID=3461496 RepID=UPI0040460668
MFSIVIPLYNKAQTIARTIDSVIKQSFTVFEVLIVNDASTDNSLEIVEQYKIDERIRVYSLESNSGAGAARNYGVRKAKYSYIAFLDGDDTWKEGYLEKMKEAIEKYPMSGMYCCAGLHETKTGLTYRIAKKYMSKITPVNYFEDPLVFTQTSAIVVYKEVFDRYGGFPSELRINQDYALFFTIGLTETVVYCGFPLSTYYIGVAGQNTSLFSIKRIECTQFVIDRINFVYKNWIKYKKENRLFTIFNKYEIRHNFYAALKKNDHNLVNLFLTQLDCRILNNFSAFEIFLYKKKYLNKMGIAYIMLTKIIWKWSKLVNRGPSKIDKLKVNSRKALVWHN